MRLFLLLLRQDPAFRAIPKIVPAAVAVGLLLRATPSTRATLAAGPMTRPTPEFPLFFLIMMICLTVWILTGNCWTRASRLSLTLPVTSRLHWTTRATSLSLLALLLVTGLMLPLVFHLPAAGGAWVVHPLILSASLRAAATILLILALLQLPWPNLVRIPVAPPYVAYGTVVILPTLLIASAGALNLWFTALLAFFALALAAWTFYVMPPSFEVGHRESEDPPHRARTSDDAVDSHEASADHPVSGSERFLLPYTLLRTLHWNGLSVINLLSIWGFTIVATAEFAEGRVILLTPVLVIAWSLQIFHQGLGRCGTLDPLPISRRRLFTYLALPVCFAIGAGLAAGFLVREPASQVRRTEDGSILPPWDTYRIVRTETAPIVVASPWGESIDSQILPLWRGSTLALVNPFETTTTSTERFCKWQEERAGTVLYRNPAENGAGEVSRLSLPRARTAAATLILAELLGTAVFALFFLQFGRSRDRALFKWLSALPLILLGAAFAGVLLLDLAGLTEIWRLGAALSVGIRVAAVKTGLESSHLWVAAGLLGVASWVLLQRLFTRVEVPGRRILRPFAEEF